MGDEGLRAIQPFLQRAEELAKVDLKVAYYCRLHAVETYISLPKEAQTPKAKELVGLVMGQLEQDKPQLDLTDKAADQAHCEQFALSVFNRADKVDRAGKANAQTAKNFLAASYFLDVCSHFGELDIDLKEKQKYAVWKAGDISKALKEGRKPTRGSPTDQVFAFRPGSKVLFTMDPTTPPENGTVAKAEILEGEQVYTVALKSTWVQGTLENLALDAKKGDVVGYMSHPDVEVLKVQLESMDTRHWPPSYVITLPDGSMKDTTAARIVQAPPQPSSIPPPPPPTTSSSGSVPPPPPAGSVSAAVAPVPPPPTGAPSGSAYPPPPPPGAAYPLPPGASFQPPPPQSAVPPPPPPGPAPVPAAAPPPVMPSPQAGFQPNSSRITAAKKAAKSAASCLDFDDVPTSIKLLTEALQLLTNPNFQG